MKKIHKIILTFIPLIITVFVCLIYFSVDALILQERGLKWRPYVTLGMIILVTLGQICFLLSLVYHLMKGIKKRKIWMKITYVATIFAIGVITFHVAMWGLFFVSLSYEHEKVVRTDNIIYVSCLSDWNPTYYHYYKYDGWFTMAAEPFESIRVEDVHY